jgi:hypothetical protein
MSPRWLSVAAAAVGLATGSAARAQSSELWPELDVYWRPAEHQRTFLELSRSNDRDGPTSQATVGLYQDYLSLPQRYLRLGYRFTFNTGGASYRESRIVGEAVVTPYAAGLARLLNRSRLELRWVNGAYSYRIRDRLHLQRMPPKPRGLALAPYVTFEAYYDSRYNTIARLAGRIGSEAQLARRVGIDVYVARQNNSRDVPRYVNALGVTTKLTF